MDDPGEERNLADPATANASSANIVGQLKEIAIGYHRYFITYTTTKPK